MSARRGKQLSQVSEGVSNEHSYSQSQRNLRHRASAPAESSESEEMDSFNCGHCKKTIYTNDPPVQCHFCDNAFCYKCSEVSTKAQYKKLSMSAKEEEGTMWFCIHCRISNPGVKKMLVRVTKLEENQTNVLERLDNLEQQNSGLDEKIRGAIYEQKEIDNRKLNVMCFGLAESTEEDALIRKADETAKLKYIIKEVLEISEEEFSFDDAPVRIGKFHESKTRPLKFVAKSFTSKKKLLDAARKKLKHSDDPEHKKLFFKPDLTKNQRVEARSRRENKSSEQNAHANKRQSNEVVVEEVGEPFRSSQRR